jgi:hypothetical protein
MAYLDDEGYEFESYQPITLFDNEPTTTEGEARLKFEIRGTDFGGGEPQPENIIDEVVGDGALTIQCDMTKVVHGTLNSGGPPATLVVFQFAFLPHGNNHRFKNAQITVTFSAGKVHSISPENEWTTLPSEKQQERTHTISPSIEAALGPAKATTAYTWQRKETETIKGYAKVTGAIKSLGQSGGFGMKKRRKNTAFWGLYEDEQARTGIPSLLQTAVLVERKATDEQSFGELFSAAIKIHGHVDRRAWIKEKWEDVGKWMSGGTREGKDITFHPRHNRGTVQHPESLGDEDLDLYRQLIAVREWETPGKTPPAPIAKIEPGSHPVPALEPEPVVAPPAPAPAPASLPARPPAAQAAATPSAQISDSDTITATLAKLALSESDLPPTAAEEDLPSPANATTTAMELVNEELPNLREQLRLVRAEAQWAIRVIGLLGEERRLLQKIGRLESPVNGVRGG